MVQPQNELDLAGDMQDDDEEDTSAQTQVICDQVSYASAAEKEKLLTW